LRARPDTFLDELQLLLQHNHAIDAPQGGSLSTICRVLQREGITRKRLSKIARERKLSLRSLYQTNLVGIRREQMVFVDETRKDDRTTYRRYGYSARGTPAHGRVAFIRGKSYSILPAITVDGFIATSIVEGSFTMRTFEQFIFYDVLPSMNPFPGPRSVLILDNCRIHKSQLLYRIARWSGIRVIFLPPYSPDLSPIEEAFAVFKRWLARYGTFVRSWGGDPRTILLYGLYSSVSPSACRGFFYDCGYFE
jgi:transposase